MTHKMTRSEIRWSLVWLIIGLVLGWVISTITEIGVCEQPGVMENRSDNRGGSDG